MSNIDTVAEEGTTPEPSEDSVALTDASEDEISSYLAEALAAEKGGKEPSSELEAAPSGNEETDSEKTEENPEEEETPQKGLTEQQLKERNEALERDLAQREMFIKRRNQEIGEARKQIRALQENLKALYAEKSIENPQEALEIQDQFNQAKQHLENLDKEEAVINKVHTNQRVMAQYVPAEDFNPDLMAASLQRDGVPADFINQFKTNPFAYADTPVELIHLQKRAKAEHALLSVVKYARELEKENSKLRAKPAKVVQNIQKNLNRSPSLNGNSGLGSDAVDSFDPGNISSMSDKELENFLKKKA